MCGADNVISYVFIALWMLELSILNYMKLIKFEVDECWNHEMRTIYEIYINKKVISKVILTYT